MGLVCCLIKFLGWIGLFRALYELANFVIYTFLAKKRTDLLEKYGEGSYAIITGSTDGIGLGYAKYLAECGFNLVCISRNAQKLSEKEKEIREFAKNRKDLKIVNIQKDFTQAYKTEFYSDMQNTLSKLDISIIVNNVGIVAEKWGILMPSNQDIINTIVVNCCSQVGMFKTVYPLLISRAKNPKLNCAIIDLSSIASSMPATSFFTIYGASKDFNRSFTLGLSSYLSNPKTIDNQKQSNLIDFLSVQPSVVDTQIVAEFKKDLEKNNSSELKLFASPLDCAIGTFGCLGKISMTPGARKHGLVWTKLEFLRGIVPANCQLKLCGF